MPREELSAQDLLAEYKGQVHVERHFHFLKDPLFVDALYVKKPARIEALGYMLRMACLLYSLLERRLRAAKVPIPSPSRRVLTRPTGHEVVRHLASLQVTRDSTGQRTVTLPKISMRPYWPSGRLFTCLLASLRYPHCANRRHEKPLTDKFGVRNRCTYHGQTTWVYSLSGTNGLTATVYFVGDRLAVVVNQ